MSDTFTICELPEDSIFLDIGSFFGRYVGSFFYYQQKRVLSNSNNDTNGYSNYIFHLNKRDCVEVDENGFILPILMCRMSSNGLSLSGEIIKEIRKNSNKVYFSGKGYNSFVLSVKEPDVGLTSNDEDLIINLFKSSWN